MEWVDVADTHDIEKGTMILVEVEGKKVVIANVEARSTHSMIGARIRMRHFIWARFMVR